MFDLRFKQYLHKCPNQSVDVITYILDILDVSIYTSLFQVQQVLTALSFPKIFKRAFTSLLTLDLGSFNLKAFFSKHNQVYLVYLVTDSLGSYSWRAS